MRPDRLKEPMRSATTLSGCRRPQTTPGQPQKWLDVFHEASKLDVPDEDDSSMDLKERSASSSVELVLFPSDTMAWGSRRHDNNNKR